MRKITILVVFVVFLAAVFAAAGTLRWTAAWVYLGLYAAAVTGLVVWLKKHDPGLLKERMSPGADPKRWDKLIVRAYTWLFVVLFVVAALDAVRFGWSRVPLALQIPAFGIIVLSAAFGAWVFKENAYLASYVRIQTERGHQVCKTGPYRIVRHPMYVAIILIVLATPPGLGSCYGLIPAALIAGLFIVRTALEDRTLRAELPGYREYAAVTRWRLVPGLW
jgi:protein-S-isoprenylcysteine O-methyltransferase Ste14